MVCPACCSLQDLAPSPEYVIGTACLASMRRLSSMLTGDETATEARAGVRQTLLTYTTRVSGVKHSTQLLTYIYDHQSSSSS